MCAVGCNGPAATGIEPPMLSLDSAGAAADGSEGSSSLSEDEYISDPEAGNNKNSNSKSSSGGSKSSSSSKVKMMCSYGGRILPRPQDGQLRYMGGETRIVVVSRDIRYMELMDKLARLAKRTVLLKYQLPNEDLDALISVTSDEDVANMMDEHDKMGAISDGATKLRAFLFLGKQRSAGSLSSEGEYACDFGKSAEDCSSKLAPAADSFHLEQDYSKLSVQRYPASPPRSPTGLPLAGYVGYPKEVFQRDGFHNAPKAKMPRNHSGERNIYEIPHEQRGLFHHREEFGSLRAYQQQQQPHEQCFDSVFMGDPEKQVKSRYPLSENAHLGHLEHADQSGQHHAQRQNSSNFYHQHQHQHHQHQHHQHQQQEPYPNAGIHHAADEGMNHHSRFAVQCKGCKGCVEASFLPPRHPPRPAAAAAALYANPHHHQFHHHQHQPAVRMRDAAAASTNPFQIDEQKAFNANSSGHHHVHHHHIL